MRDFDLSPLYRSAIGFDRLASMLDNASRNDNQPSYPPYNIELLGENAYRITMAVAGFTIEELDIQSENSTLLIAGTKHVDKDQHQYLYQGIAARNFERRFQLADHVKVMKAHMENGLLHVDLIREIPEAMKPRSIKIER
ncbi:Hsp20 family protein [Pontibacterium sp. N1Y112]|uniref:Hsp20 family protein n=1 Tax=Pontibacterium sinense TaxID=2781979 RepID=A0A8J7F6Y6_9GAMM|nr:Hsp20 family protein [Pontibacterium sinense]MBE9396235.1 Hsp20 family protein [Pontibacterium sinense]MCO4757197.1 Hsp20 family protein [Oceanospirillaceae bacterium]